MRIREWCFPEQARQVRWGRAACLVLRAVHLVAVGLLLGGHTFGASPDALFPWLVVAVATGAGLIVPEVLGWGLYWFVLAKGMSVLAKLALLIAVPLAWEARVPILVTVLLWAAVTAHMPARLRNYSFLHGRVVDAASPLRHHARSLPPNGSLGVWPRR